MTELTQTDADDAFHEIQLSVKQLVFLFMAATVVGVFIFLLGVSVGRGVKTTHTEETADNVAALPPTASTPGTQAPASTASPSAEAPPAADEDAGLSYPKRLQSEATPAEKLAPKTEPPPAKPVEQPKAAAPVSKPEPAPTRAGAPSAGRPGVWVVQLVALKDRAAASAVVQRLTAKGYPAFVVSPAAGAPSIYRVQVGRYNDRREAEQVARRLEKEEQFKPWISH